MRGFLLAKINHLRCFMCDAAIQRFAGQKPGQESLARALPWRMDGAANMAVSIPVRPGKVLFVVQKMGKGYLYINLLHDARPLKAKEDLNELPRWVSGELGLSSFTKAKARKVEFTPFGKLRHKHRTLWYGKRTQKA